MKNTNIKRVSELFSEFCLRKTDVKSPTGKLYFTGVDGLDVYNITAPFVSANKTIIAGRVEPRDQEHSKVMFFEEKDNLWHPVVGAPIFILQDPFVTFIQGELIFGGVEIKEVVHKKTKQMFEWRTIFYRGTDIFDLGKFFTGPVGMKDIRLCEINKDKIAIFTRPQGEIGGRGSIGYTEVNNLNLLSIDIINAASLLENMFHPMDWGGVNEATLLNNGDIGLLAHIAYFEQDDKTQERHYYSAAFTFDPILRKYKNLRIIASRDQFKDGAAKKVGLKDVIFSSGLINDKGITTLFVGASDAEAHWIEIADPFNL